MEHVWAAYTHEVKDFSYRRYMADVTRLIGENLAILTQGKYVNSIWGETPKKEEPEDGDAIALDIIKRAGLKFKENQNGPV